MTTPESGRQLQAAVPARPRARRKRLSTVIGIGGPSAGPIGHLVTGLLARQRQFQPLAVPRTRHGVAPSIRAP